MITVLDKAVAVLRSGGLLIYPTETFYALGADYSQISALERVLKLKGRGEQHPLPLIIGSNEQLPCYCAATFALSPQTQRLMNTFWPGPLTLVLPAAQGLHSSLLSPPLSADGLPGVAVRVSSHPVTQGLASGFGQAIVSTSANISGQPPAVRVTDLPDSLLSGVDMILDTGPCSGGQPSTILDVRQTPRIVRQGVLRLPEWAFIGYRV